MGLIGIMPALGVLLLSYFATTAAHANITDNKDEILKAQTTVTRKFSGTNDTDDSFFETFKQPLEPAEISTDSRPLKEAIPSDFDITETKLSVVALSNLNSEIFSGPANCVCGRPSEKTISTFIVNGDTARINDHPWAVALVRRQFGLFGFGRWVPYCGATLINSRFVLTAAHCVDGMSTRGFEVRIREEDFRNTSEVEGGTKRVAAEEIIVHPYYNPRTIDHDIALIRLAEEIPMDGVFVPACLPANNDHSFEGDNATVLGWGSIKNGGITHSPTLMKITVPILSNVDCSTKTKYEGKITENMMCAGNIEAGGKDSCSGDSGGPLTIENGGRTTVVGVVSWGYGCAKPKSPGVYTRVARYAQWISVVASKAIWCSA